MEDMDYAVQYVEYKFGTGAVFEMMDYIMEKKKEEDSSA